MRRGFNHSVGVGRPYSGTAGRIENSQIGVFACYASRFGHALIDRQLYLPKDWAADEARRKKAHVPGDATFATKPAMAREIIARTLDADLPCAWVLADALYGADSALRHMLKDRRQSYVLAVRSNHTLRFLEEDGLIQTNPAALAEEINVEDWSCLSAGEGAKGPRLYEWARLPMGSSKNDDFERWVLFRKNLRDPKALAYYFVHAP